MRTNNFNELLLTVEKIRAEKYPHISPELLEKIIKAEFDHQDSRANASELVNKIVAATLEEEGK